MNLVKLRSVVGRVLKSSTTEHRILSSTPCVCVTRKILGIGDTALFSTSTSESDGIDGLLRNKRPPERLAATDGQPPKYEFKTATITDSVDYKVKGDPDTFGTLSDANTFEDIPGDEGDRLEESFLENPPHPHSKLRTKQYADLIKKCIREKRFADAIDVLETKMIKEDRVKPEVYIYNLIIGACGRWGYTKKAFQLYNQMKKRGLKANDPTYTGLFNSCSNSPWPEDGLKRAVHLRKLMIEKGIEFNTLHYHAMMKAFGHCGDLEMAFAVVDEMVEKQCKLTSETFNFLLQACITDEEAGFRHGILVWRKMIQKKIKPDIFSYNLMLRSVRDCGIGDVSVAQNVLEQVSQHKGVPPLPVDKTRLMVESGESIAERKALEVDVKCLQSENGYLPDVSSSVSISRENRPNLLAKDPHLGNIVQISEITKPQDRLLLIGGSSGVLQQMAAEGITPNIKTFTLLLDSIPSTIAAENALLSAMKKHGIQCDIDFFNMLIKKRSMRFDYVNAREVLRLIQFARLHPDIVTFGVLALGCCKEDEARELLTDMKTAGFRINAEILGAMLHQACIRHDFHYVLKIMYITKEEGIKPNAQFLKHLENLNTSCWDILKNKNKDMNVPEYIRSKSFSKDFRNFSYRYRAWLKDIKHEEEVHPWEQFRKKQPQEERGPGFIKRKNYSSVVN